MRQSIKAGISVESGSEVDLTISAGPEIVEEEEEPENEVEMEVDYTIHINPPENPDNNEEYTVNILKNDENGSSDYLEKSFAYEDGPQTISFKDKAGLKFELYIDGNFDRTISQ